MIFDLEGSEALMIEDFSNLASIELEVEVSKVNEEDDAPEHNEHRVIKLTHGIKWIITDFISERLIVGVSFLFPSRSMGVTTGENMLMAELKKNKLENMALTYWRRPKSFMWWNPLS